MVRIVSHLYILIWDYFYLMWNLDSVIICYDSLFLFFNIILQTILMWLGSTMKELPSSTITSSSLPSSDESAQLINWPWIQQISRPKRLMRVLKRSKHQSNCTKLQAIESMVNRSNVEQFMLTTRNLSNSKVN